MDTDYVIRYITRGTLPPPPVRTLSVSANAHPSSVSLSGSVVTAQQADESASSKKRKLDNVSYGLDNAPPDAFKERQARREEEGRKRGR